MSIKVEVSWKQDDSSYKCPYCDKLFTYKGISTHIWRSHTDDGIKHKEKCSRFGRKAWNKGLTSENSEGVLKMKTTLKRKFDNGEITPSFLGRKHKPESIKKLKENSGGYRRGSGRGKSGWYKDYWCDSTWELAWVIYNIDHDIKFSRFREGFEYIYNNEKHKYYPDFILEDNKTLIEIKGYKTDKDIYKLNSIDRNRFNLIVIDKMVIGNYLKYVKSKYLVKNLYDLYTDHKSKEE